MSGTPTDPPTNPDSINKRFDEVTEYLIRLIDEQIAIKQRLDVLEKPHDNSLERLCKLWDAYNAQMHKWMAKRTDEIYDFMIAAWRTNPSSKGGEWYAINPYQTSLDHGFLNQVHTFMESIGNKAQPKPVEPSFPDPRLAAPKPVPAPPAPPAAPPAPPAPPAGLPPPSAAPAPPMTYAVAAATVPDTDTSSAAAAGPSTSASPTAQVGHGPLPRFGPSPIFANDNKITVREWLRVMKQNAIAQRIGSLTPVPNESENDKIMRQQLEDTARIQWAQTFIKPGSVTQRWHAEVTALEREGSCISQWSDFEYHFARVFGAPDPEADARHAIHKPQGYRNIHDWADMLYAKFAELETLGKPMDNSSQLFILQRYMDRNLYDKIVLSAPTHNFTTAREILEAAKAYVLRVRDYNPHNHHDKRIKTSSQSFRPRQSTPQLAAMQQQASKKAKADAKAELGEAERILGYRIRGGMSFPPGKCEVLSRGQLEAVYGVMRGHEMDLKGRGQPSRFICWKCQNAGWLPQVHAIRDCPNPDQQPLPKKA